MSAIHSGKSIAIVGGNGFIGRNLTRYFVGKGYEVIVIGRNIESKSRIDNVSYFSIDIHHTKEVINALKGASIVVWLVHASVPSTLDESLIDDFMLNISPIIRFLEKAKDNKDLNKFIYFSSGGTVYGNPTSHTPMLESHPTVPISNYGISKLVAENYVSYLLKDSNVQSIIVRPANVYGPYQNLVKPQGVIGFAFKALFEDKPFDVYNNGMIIRDFLHISDLNDAIEHIIMHDSSSTTTEVFNLGSGVGMSIKDLLLEIEVVAGKTLMMNHKPSRSFDCDYNVLDFTKLNNHTGWKPKESLYNGLQDVWQWINKSSN
jgi:UDP-glucose 4-epimerase